MNVEGMLEKGGFYLKILISTGCILIVDSSFHKVEGFRLQLEFMLLHGVISNEYGTGYLLEFYSLDGI
jgi:hypothetical protein